MQPRDICLARYVILLAVVAVCGQMLKDSLDQAYFIAFSLIILHTDVFNKNNKHKMQRQDYIKNTSGEGISDDILECFYDNISYTPFIHVEDDVDINGEKIVPHKSRRNLFTRGSADAIKRPSKEPVDPYTLIIDSKLDVLRPSLKDVMNLDDPYCYLGTADSLDLANLHKTFFRSAVLQIVSARSRPEAFMSPTTISNPEEAHPGVVDIKVTKVGLLWRKEAKKKKARSPWQEWGAILTGSQLYFFRNTTWIKNLMHQYDAHHKHGHAGAPVTFKPPLENFKPDALMSTDDAVALLDSSYKKHKNSFVFVRHGGLEETFLADSDSEMNDWLAKLNYAAAFRTAGVRMRGLVGGNYEGQRTRGIRRMDAGNSVQSVQTPTGEVSILSGKIDAQLAQQILAARRQIMMQKISEAEEKLSLAQKQLDDQLRNARHLQILAPIQAKTREQVVLAAGRMAAKLKWVRVEMWKLRCHKDILMMDLEDEKRSTIDKQLRQQAIATPALAPLSSPDPQRDEIAKLGSRTSRSRSPQRSPRTPTETRPPKSASLKEHDFGVEDIFHAPSHLSRQSSYRKNPPSWELPPLAFDTSPIHRGSISSTHPTSPASSSLTHPQSRSSGIGSDGQPSFADVIGGESRAEDNETDVLNGAGLSMVDGPPSDPRIAEVTSEDDNQKGKVRKGSEAEATERGKSRRSLRGTLRDAHAPSHHRSRRGKDSGSSAITEDSSLSPESEGLARGTGSFTVHGKKASVITFGSEWQSVLPEERLRLRKQSHTDETKSSAHTTADNEGESSIFPPLVSLRRESAASQSTATVRSFQRWESREDADTESLAALSVSDGRRTPLKTIQDEMEEGRLPSSHGKEKKTESSEEHNGEKARTKDGVPQRQPLPQAVSV
jgi:Sec7 domain/PH domain